MPDDPNQRDAPSLTTTSANLAGIARESLEASIGQAKLASLVREALLVGTGIAGRITARSSAQGAVTTTSAGLVIQGRMTAASAAKAAGQFRLNLAAAIKSTSSAQCYFQRHLVFGSRITAMSSSKLIQLGQLPVAGRVKAQSSASGLVYLQSSGVNRQYGVVINTG